MTLEDIEKAIALKEKLEYLQAMQTSLKQKEEGAKIRFDIQIGSGIKLEKFKIKGLAAFDYAALEFLKDCIKTEIHCTEEAIKEL